MEIHEEERADFLQYQKAAGQGDADAMNSLGVCYENGTGVEADVRQAAEWYRRAAELGNKYAMNNLGWCYKNGTGVEKDARQAVEWYRKAAELGNKYAMNNLGVCYDDGTGVEKDARQAAEWYRRAAELGNEVAMNNLGVCYDNGTGVEKDARQAVEWYRRAAELGNAAAMNNLGVCYENGTGVEKDARQALSWYDKGTESGSSIAGENAEELRQKLYFIPQDVPVELKLEQCQNTGKIGHAVYAFAELNQMIGLNSVKQEVKGIIDALKLNQMRVENGLPGVKMSRHMVFTGNAGTGKTTVARILGKIFKEYGVLSKGHFVEVSRENLVGKWIGETAPKTKKKVEEALGGVLFIDEAYSLVPEDAARDFGAEVISTLIKMMEDHRDDLIVIVAGYREEMQRFIESNQGLKSRFSKYIDFPDYSPMEMQQIFDRQAKEGRYNVTEKARCALLDVWSVASQYKDFGNGRGVRNIFEKVIQKLATRVAAVSNPDRDDLVNILAVDVPSLEELKASLTGKGK